MFDYHYARNISLFLMIMPFGESSTCAYFSRSLMIMDSFRQELHVIWSCSLDISRKVRLKEGKVDDAWMGPMICSSKIRLIDSDSHIKTDHKNKRDSDCPQFRSLKILPIPSFLLDKVKSPVKGSSLKKTPKKLLSFVIGTQGEPVYVGMQIITSQNDQNIMIKMKEEQFECQMTHKIDGSDKQGQVSKKSVDNIVPKNKFKIIKKKSKNKGFGVDEQDVDQNGAQLAKCLINLRVAVDDNAPMIAQLLSPSGTSKIKPFLSQQATPYLLMFLRKLTSQQLQNVFSLQQCKMVHRQAQQIFEKCYSSIFSLLSAKDLSEYEIISGEYEAIRSSGDQSQRKVRKQKQINECKVRSAQKMFKIDILSLLLLKDYQYQQLFVRNGVSKIGISLSQLISKRFKVQDSKSDYFPKLLRNMMNYLSFDYYEDFKDIISLLNLIEIAFQVNYYGYQRKRLSEKSQRRMMKDHFKCINLEERKERFSQRSQTIRFKFCEVAGFYAKEYISEDFLRLNKDHILARLKNITPSLSFFQKKRHIVRVRVASKLPLVSICKWYEELLQNPLVRQEELQNYRKKLQPCKWIYLSTTNMEKSIEKLTGITIQKGSLSKENPISIALIQLVYQRLKECSYFTNLQIQFARKVKKIDPVYIFLYNFHFDKIFRCHQEKYRQCAKCSIIIAMRNQQIVFVQTTEKKIQFQQLPNILLRNFQNSTMINRGDLVIFKNDYSREIEKGTYVKLINTFKRKHNSHVYITSDPSHFQLSFAICYGIIYALKRYGKGVNQTNFSEQIALYTTKVVLSLCQGQKADIKKEQ